VAFLRSNHIYKLIKTIRCYIASNERKAWPRNRIHTPCPRNYYCYRDYISNFSITGKVKRPETRIPEEAQGKRAKVKRQRRKTEKARGEPKI